MSHFVGSFIRSEKDCFHILNWAAGRRTNNDFVQKPEGERAEKMKRRESIRRILQKWNRPEVSKDFFLSESLKMFENSSKISMDMKRNENWFESNSLSRWMNFSRMVNESETGNLIRQRRGEPRRPLPLCWLDFFWLKRTKTPERFRKKLLQKLLREPFISELNNVLDHIEGLRELEQSEHDRTRAAADRLWSLRVPDTILTCSKCVSSHDHITF